MYMHTDLKAKKALLEIWKEINYNYYPNPQISVTNISII
jgi:hypothetical protein